MKKWVWILSATALFTLMTPQWSSVAAAVTVQGRVAKGSDSLPAEVSMSSVWKQAALSSFDAILPDTRAWVPVRVSEEGVFVGNVPAQKPVVKPAQIILYDARSGNTETVASLQEHWQVGEADLNNHWLVWTESLWDDYGLKDQKLHVYNRLTKTDKIIATGTNLPYQNPFWVPKVEGDEVVWSQAVEQAGDQGLTYGVFQYDIDNGKQTIVTDQGAAPVISKHDLMWVGPDQETNQPALFSTRHGQPEEFFSGVPLSYFSTDGKEVVWSGYQEIDRYDGNWEVGLTDLKGNSRLIKKSDAADALQFVSIGSRLVAWTSYEKVQVYDRKLDQIVTLEEKDAPYSNVQTNDHYMFWTTPIPQTDEERQNARKNGILPATIHMVDVNRL
jgi:hypothetical protein